MAEEARKKNRQSLAAKAIVVEEEKQPLSEKLWEKFINYYANEGAKFRFTVVWILANLIYFTYTYRQIQGGSTYFAVGPSVGIAKGCGALLRLNCCFTLLPVCRSLMLWARETFLNNVLFPVDKAIAFHKKLGWSIAIISYIHTISHLYNFRKLSTFTGTELQTEGLNGQPILLHIPKQLGPNTRWTVPDWLFYTLPGLTGVILCVVMLFMYAAAARKVRSPYFEAFWFTHHL